MDSRLNQSIQQRGRPVSTVDAAKANDVLEHFINSGTLKTILGNYRNMCELLHLKPNVFPLFYPKLKANLNSWKAKALWKKFDARASHKCYIRGKVCPNTRVLIIGAGPCGLRTAIEAQLLGAKVVVIEKRDRVSRNNVLHLWPFVIEDLRALGAKKFFGKFCAGAIDHISIRQLQCILLKVALLLGVEVHTEVSFERLVEPNSAEKIGWRAEFKPTDHPVSQYEFDVIIGADGKRNTLQGFKRKEFRGKLAIAITANFINKRTEAEARVEEISGVAFIFNQKFFKELNAETGIDLENIVYYKDDTHYFVMTAKKLSLIDKGVIKQDYTDTARLLSPDNVDRDALLNYAREAADFSTNYQMPDLEFAVNHYGQPDVAMFDFTSMYAAENASKVVERHGYKLLTILVGDSLLEPFWPTGSGCARGFLSSLDACWAIKAWGSGMVTPLEVLAERESIYRLLAQTTPENLNKDCKAYTLDPSTRYPNLNRAVLLPQQVLSLFDSDDPSGIELTPRVPQPISATDLHRKRRRRDIHLDPNTLISWIKEQIKDCEDLTVEDVTTSFKDGRVLCAILHHYRPDLLDYSAIKAEDVAKNNQLAFDLLEKEIGIPPVMTGEDMAKADVPDYLTMFSYLTQIYDTFRGEIPHIKHPKLSSQSQTPLQTSFNVLTFSKTDKQIPNDNQSKFCSNKFPPTSWIQTKSQILRQKSCGFAKRKAMKSMLKKINENRKRFHSWEVLNRDTLNFKPVKSIEEYSNCDRNSKMGSYSAESLIDSLDFDKNKSIQYTDCVSELSDGIKYFDENFKEIPTNTFSEENIESQNIAEITINDKDESAMIIFNSETETSDAPHDNNDSDSSISDIIVRCVEEDINSISVRELKFCSCSNTFVINKALKHAKMPIARKFEDQVCNSNSNNDSCKNKLLTGNKGKEKQSESACQFSDFNKFKFLYFSNMSSDTEVVSPELTYDRIVDWINFSDFKERDGISDMDTDVLERLTDITSVTQNVVEGDDNDEDYYTKEKIVDPLKTPKDIKVEERTEEVKCVATTNCSKTSPAEISSNSLDSISKLMEKLKSNNVTTFPKIAGTWRRPLSKITVSEPPLRFTSITESEETDLPEPKEITTPAFTPKVIPIHSSLLPMREMSAPVITRSINRSKRHAEPAPSAKPTTPSERKPKKRKSFEKYDFGGVEERRKRLEEIEANRTDRQNKRRHHRRMQTEQFIKSMQMLQTNAKPDSSEPFEDYSLFVYRQTAPQFQDRVKNLEKMFTYVPDRENRLPSQTRGAGADEELAARIKDLEDKWRDPVPVDKKPKDLMRAIGKIQTSDWNIKEIEKKIIENKLGKNVNKEKERVPKWNREQFLARQTKLEKLDRQNSGEAKYTEVDKTIKHLEQRLKEGSVRDLGQNKVASITEKLVPKAMEPEAKPVLKSNPKPVVLPTQSGSEYCHFCQKRVYLMERLSAEGRFFHRGCFKCQYCHTTLRLGSYMFDRDGQYGHRFYCTQHYGMPGELYSNKVEQKSSLKREHAKPLEKLKIIPLTGVEGVDLLDRVQTPERIEFANLSAGHISSDHDESLSQMDEDEWTDRNFGASTAEVCSSDDDEDSSSLSGSESDNEDAFEEALEEPPTKEGTLRWMERYKQRYSKERRRDDDSDSEDYSSTSDHSSYYENSSGDEEDEPATEGEEEIRARELRKQEVRVEPPVVHTDTGSDTEIVSDDSSSESSSKQNSATEISTDSEFAVDEPTPTREVPSIIFNDFNVTKTRGNFGPPKKVQVKSSILQTPISGKTQKQGIKLEFTPLVPSSPVITKPTVSTTSTSLLARTEGYALNRTQSTGGIATKVSLELKKKYLLGDSNVPGSIQKSGSVSTLDSKFKSFHTNISDCQKLLKPAPEISPSMQVFCNKLNERRSPLSPIISQTSPFSDGKEPLKSPDIVSPIEKRTPEVIDLTVSPSLEQPDVTKCSKEAPLAQESKPAVFEQESEGRPRSPVQEIPIIVPQIDWSKTSNKQKESDISSDSLTSDSDDSDEEHTGIQKSPTVKIFNTIPRVEVHDDVGDEIALDSLCPVSNQDKTEISPVIETTSIPSLSDSAPKSITSEKKSLNQPKTLPGLQNDYVRVDLHNKVKLSTPENEQRFIVSGQSTPSDHDSYIEHTTAALTETELSDWARDSAVSDDFEDVEFELNPDFVGTRKNKQPKTVQGSTRNTNSAKIVKANIDEFDDLVGHVCGRDKQMKDLKNKISLSENLSNILSSLEFMDTGEETSSDEKVLVEATMKNNGYVEFQNEDDIVEDSLNPNINDIVETVNPEIRESLNLENLSNPQKNTGYCIIGNEDNFGGEIINLKQSDVEKLKEKQNQIENEEDSLLVVETGTTTEENTCSDSTVKNIIEKEKVSEKEKKDILNVASLINENKTLLEKIKVDFNKQEDVNNREYKEHCQRLQSKVEFGNVRDSIDIRKSKRKDKSELPPKPDLIQEETPSPVHHPVINPSLDVTVTTATTSPTVTPKTIYTKEEIQKVRDENQRLVQEMVMNKMKAQNRSLERKKRSRNSFSPNRSPFELNKSATTDISSQLNNSKEENEKRISTYSAGSGIYFTTPDVILTTTDTPKARIPLEKSHTVTSISELTTSTPISSSLKQHPRFFTKQLSIHSSFQSKPKTISSSPLANPEAFSLPDIQQALLKEEDFKTPKAPPRQKYNEEARRTAEKLKQEAKLKARMKSNEDLGLSPEDKLKKLKERINNKKGGSRNNENVDIHIQDSIESLVLNTERRNSLLYSNDTLTKKRNNSFKRSKSGEDTFSSGCPVRTKSVSEISKSFTDGKLTEVDLNVSTVEENKNKLQFCKSDPNLLTETYVKVEKKNKSKDRERRKSITKLISEFFVKKKDGVKNATSAGTTSKGFLARISPKSKSKNKVIEERIARTNSFSENTTHRRIENVSPPPIPPLPLNYSRSGPSRCIDDSSDGENEWRHQEQRSSCDTLDQSGVHEGRRVSKSARKAARQAQLKRHRMAQEIQRKLEETEVKTRELEQRGVSVEKALRGEACDVQGGEESDLLKEWFDLMRDLTELRRYERELMVRAQELELEDSHARLQQELRERLENEEHKTKDDIKMETSIINEMMEIVSKRDSLIALLEQDRLRYSEEDRDFEEQMLAKGLRLTPIQKTPTK